MGEEEKRGEERRRAEGKKEEGGEGGKSGRREEMIQSWRLVAGLGSLQMRGGGWKVMVADEMATDGRGAVDGVRCG